LKNKQNSLNRKLSINKNFLIGFISSITTAAMGYILRLIHLNY